MTAAEAPCGAPQLAAANVPQRAPGAPPVDDGDLARLLAAYAWPAAPLPALPAPLPRLPADALAARDALSRRAAAAAWVARFGGVGAPDPAAAAPPRTGPREGHVVGLPRHQRGASAIALTGDRLAIGDMDGRVVFFDTAHGTRERCFRAYAARIHRDRRLGDLFFDRDGSLLGVPRDGGRHGFRPRRWCGETGRLLRTYPATAHRPRRIVGQGGGTFHCITAPPAATGAALAAPPLQEWDAAGTRVRPRGPAHAGIIAGDGEGMVLAQGDLLTFFHGAQPICNARLPRRGGPVHAVAAALGRPGAVIADATGGLGQWLPQACTPGGAVEIAYAPAACPGHAVRDLALNATTLAALWDGPTVDLFDCRVGSGGLRHLHRIAEWRDVPRRLALSDTRLAALTAAHEVVLFALAGEAAPRPSSSLAPIPPAAAAAAAAPPRPAVAAHASAAGDARPATPPRDGAAARLAAPGHEVCAEPAAVAAWLRQFASADARDSAQRLLAAVDFHGLRRLQGELACLHARLLAHLQEDADLACVDFATAPRAAGGARLAYLYSTTNRLGLARFTRLDALRAAGGDRTRRTLVLIDDYLGSGARMLDLWARAQPELLSSYREVVVAVVVAHPHAVDALGAAARGDVERVRGQLAGYLAPGPDQERVLAAVAAGRLRGLRLLHGQLETPLVQRARQTGPASDAQLETFLGRRITPDHAAEARLGGSTCFFYGCPSSLPEIFWNRALPGEHAAWRPLFTADDDGPPRAPLARGWRGPPAPPRALPSR